VDVLEDFSAQYHVKTVVGKGKSTGIALDCLNSRVRYRWLFKIKRHHVLKALSKKPGQIPVTRSDVQRGLALVGNKVEQILDARLFTLM
jgi:hypothetical protein